MGCRQAGASSNAHRTPCQGAGDWGGRQRSGPTGGAANGTPRKAVMEGSPTANPSSVPCSHVTCLRITHVPSRHRRLRQRAPMARSWHHASNHRQMEASECHGHPQADRVTGCSAMHTAVCRDAAQAAECTLLPPQPSQVQAPRTWHRARRTRIRPDRRHRASTACKGPDWPLGGQQWHRRHTASHRVPRSSTPSAAPSG